MPQKLNGILHYTKAEIDQMMTGGLGAAISARNARAITVPSTSWNAQVGGDLDGWSYADVTHGPPVIFGYFAALIGADARIHVCDGSNEVQEVLSSTQIRIWLRDAPSYSLFCLLVYA
jgi:hypothetical protein